MSERGATQRLPGHTRKTDWRSAALVHSLLIALSLLAVLPIAVTVMDSLKNVDAIFSHPFAVPIGQRFSWQGYRDALSTGDFGHWFMNSLIVTVTSTVLTVLLSSLSGFGLSQYRVKLAVPISGLFVIGVLLPLQLGAVALLRMMIAWHLVDHPIGLILVYTGAGVPLGSLLLSTYFRSLPTEISDSARVDGAGELWIWRMLLPLVRPGAAAVAAITMLPIWNDLWFPLILTPNNPTLTLGLTQFVGQHTDNWPAILAGLTMGIVPIILLFIAFSRQFVDSLSEGFDR